MSVFDYSTTAASNTSVGGVNIQTGMSPGLVDNALRAIPADLAKYLKDVHGALTAGGTADALTLSTNSSISAYADGQEFSFVAASANTTAATLNIDSVGAKAIRKFGDEALVAGDIAANGHYTVRYDASANSAAGAFILVNPTRLTTALRTKLDGIATGATANSSDATLLARANHTGTQAISTVTNLQTTLDAKLPLTGGTLTGDLTVGNGTAGPATYLNKLAGQISGYWWQTGGVNRWAMNSSSGAETGSNAGSDIQMAAYADGGSFLGLAYSITRATQVFNFTQRPTSGGAPLALQTHAAAGTQTYQNTSPTTADGGADFQFYRNATGLTGGTPGYVNTALTVRADTGATETAYEWASLAIMNNYAAAGENVASYCQATKHGQGQTWAGVDEVREDTGATYGALVGREVALSANGTDASNVRVVVDVIGARYDDTATIPEIYAGVRINAAWNGSGSGVESAKFKNPLIIQANWTENAIKIEKRVDIAATSGTFLYLFNSLVPDGGNSDQLQIAHYKTASAGGWTNTDVLIRRNVDSTIVGQISFVGGGGIKFDANNSQYVFDTLPTSSAGLPTGAIWNNSGVINVA